MPRPLRRDVMVMAPNHSVKLTARPAVVHSALAAGGRAAA
jgi:hypothetical protein